MFAPLRDCLLVGVGGAVGSLARYGIGLAAARAFGTGFPWGTLLVNVGGCFVMGIVLERILDLEARPLEGFTPAVRAQLTVWQKGIAIGFLGGLTTFSTFGADTLRALSGGQMRTALANIAANVVFALLAVWLGMAAVKALD